MPLPLVKELLRNSFWDYPAYVPNPKWEYLYLDVREVDFLSKMRRAAKTPAFPLPRIWQGLLFDIATDVAIGNSPGTCTGRRSDLDFESCHHIRLYSKYNRQTYRR